MDAASVRRRPAAPSAPLLVSALPELVDAVLTRLPPSLSVAVAPAPGEARHSYAAAPRVLVAADLLEGLAATRPARRSDVALLLPAGAPPPDAAACVRLGVEQVLDVEEAAGWLGSPAPDGSGLDGRLGRPIGRLVAVTGARGGCGTSTLASALALSAAAAGADVLFVDLDFQGGGLDVLLGAEHRPGARWPELCRPLPDDDLFAHLPTVGGLRLLSADRTPDQPPAGVVAQVLARSVDAARLIVVDLPRTTPVDVLPEPNRVLVVVPDEVRTTAAAAMRLATLPAASDAALVVRDGPGGEPADEIAARLNRPLAGRLRHEKRLAERAERALARPARPRTPLWRLADRLLVDLEVADPAGRR